MEEHASPDWNGHSCVWVKAIAIVRAVCVKKNLYDLCMCIFIFMVYIKLNSGRGAHKFINVVDLTYVHF